MKLIDADALQKVIHEHHYLLKDAVLNAKDFGMFTGGIDYAIQTAPTIDAVEVVRCKDCKYMNTEVVNGKPYYECSIWEYFETPLNGYCHKAIPVSGLKVQKPITAQWIWNSEVRCSHCNYKLETTGLPVVCPNCGAMMTG